MSALIGVLAEETTYAFESGYRFLVTVLCMLLLGIMLCIWWVKRS